MRILAIIVAALLFATPAFALDSVTLTWQHPCTDNEVPPVGLKGFNVYQQASAVPPYNMTDKIFVAGCVKSLQFIAKYPVGTFVFVTALDNSNVESLGSFPVTYTSPVFKSILASDGTWKLMGKISPYEILHPDGLIDGNNQATDMVVVNPGGVLTIQKTDTNWYKWVNGTGWVLTATPIPPVIILPPLAPSGLIISKATSDQVVVQCAKTDCSDIAMSVAGSNVKGSTQLVRTLTRVK